MAGNRKNSRTSANIRSTLKFKGTALPTLDLPPDASTLKQLADMAYLDLNTIVEGNGKMKNWMGVLFRVHVGYCAFTNYYRYSEDADICLYNGVQALRCVQIRAQQTGELGVLVWEFDAIVAALRLTEDIMRRLRLSENTATHYEVDNYFKDLTEVNTKLSQESIADAANEQTHQVEKVA